MRATLEQAVKDYSTPKATLSFLGGSGISKTSAITIGFTETIDTASLRVGGSMAPESDGGVWSSKASSNDTLTVRPKSQWSLGSGKTLTVECSDLEGYPTPKIDVTYGVLDGIVYVRTNGSDSNPGTDDLPKNTIQAAITLAAAIYTSAEVHVAKGDYIIYSQNDGTIHLQDGISVFGGYPETAWSPRDPVLNTTSINDKSAQGYNETIEAEGVSRDTVLDGFTILAGGGTSSAAIYCVMGSPVIRNNTIKLGGGALRTYGIAMDQNSAPLIEGNTIIGDASHTATGITALDSNPTIRNNTIESTMAEQFYGIINSASSPEITANTLKVGGVTISGCGISNVSGSDPVIRNNTIDGGTGMSVDATGCTAIMNVSSSPIIQSNTIRAGTYNMESIGVVIGISNSLGSRPTIENNIIFTGAALSKTCVWEMSHDSLPTAFRNNYFYIPAPEGAKDGEYYDQDTTTIYTNDPSSMESYLTHNGVAAASDNVFGTVDPATVFDADWDFTGSPPTSLTDGGINFYSLFTQDKKGRIRPSTGLPWSIGAYRKP
jgi:hypothetical protein